MRKIGKERGVSGIKEERKQLSFFKIFQSANISSEKMRAIPYNFMRKVSERDFSEKMVIRAQWGSWKINISQNPRSYFMEKRGWEKFVSENALGENEFVTFTHKGMMSFKVNIYEQTGKEILTPRRSIPLPSKRIKTEQGESTHKGVKKEVEEIGESVEDYNTHMTKKKMSKSKYKEGDKNAVPECTFTIKKSYLRFLAVPKQFADKHIPEDMDFEIHHPNGTKSWIVYSLVRKTGTTFSSGWVKMAREYPLAVGDICTLKLIKPNELLLVVKPKSDGRLNVM